MSYCNFDIRIENNVLFKKKNTLEHYMRSDCGLSYLIIYKYSGTNIITTVDRIFCRKFSYSPR